MRPDISIVIPMYNRRESIGRTLASCLAQDFRGWEAIVVDDASTDDSCAVVSEFADPRIRLIPQKDNRGPCAVRNVGARAALAEWLLFLDSDDEIAPGGLEAIWNRCRKAPPGVEKLLFGCRWDDGTVSPDPPFKGDRFDYQGYVRWLESMVGRPAETIPAVRREAFLRAPYPEERTWEGSHNLDFAKLFDTIGCPEVVRLYHLDAGNRRMGAGKTAEGLMFEAPSLALMTDMILAAHSEALRRWAPKTYHSYLRSGGMYHMLAGNRSRGAGLTWRAFLRNPTDLKTLAVLASSWLPARIIARLKARTTA